MKPTLSITPTHIVVQHLTFKGDVDATHALGGRLVPISRRSPPGLAFQFPKQEYIIHMLRRTINNLELDQSVVDFLSRPLTSLDPEIEINPNLYDYQKECVHFLSFDSSLLSIPPGRGKTIVALEACRLLGLNRILIVAPIILLSQWKEEIRKWDPRDLPIETYRVSGVKPSFDGYTLTNYEMITKNIPLFTEKFWDVLILDESILIKSRNAVRTKRLLKLRPKCYRVWELSGFPMTRDISDLWSQFHVAKPTSFRSFWTFASEYCRIVPSPWGSQIVGSKPGIDLQTEFRDILKIVPEDVIDIPKGEIERLGCTMTSEQSRLYLRAENDFVLALQSGEIPIQNRLTQMIRLSQIISNLSTIGQSSNSGKLIALSEMIELGYLRPPVLIWGRYVESIRAVQKLLSGTKMSVRSIDGSTSEKDREQILAQYKSGNLDVLVMNSAVGKYGLNLTMTQTVVYYDLSFFADDLFQSFYRVFRIGLDHVPNVYALCMEGTIDDLISTNLEGKISDLSALTQQELLGLFQLVRQKRNS